MPIILVVRAAHRSGFRGIDLFSVSEAWIVRFAAGPIAPASWPLYTSVLALSFGPARRSSPGSASTASAFRIGAALLVAATMPMFFWCATAASGRRGDRRPHHLAFAPDAPILLAAVGLFAIIDAANLGFLPVYGVKKGMDQETAALVLTAFIVGNIVLQFPIGWLADHLSKRG